MSLYRKTIFKTTIITCNNLQQYCKHTATGFPWLLSYTKEVVSYESVSLIWKSNKKHKEVKNHDFQRTVFRTQALKVAGRPDNYDCKEARNIGTKRKQVATIG